jgi:hypothetical protein
MSQRRKLKAKLPPWDEFPKISFNSCDFPSPVAVSREDCISPERGGYPILTTDTRWRAW